VGEGKTKMGKNLMTKGPWSIESLEGSLDPRIRGGGEESSNRKTDAKKRGGFGKEGRGNDLKTWRDN